MTPDTFMSISQQSKPKSSPNKLGWKASFDPRPTVVTSALQLDCFQLRFLWVASLQATTETAGTGFTWDLRTTKLTHKKKSYCQSCCKQPLELLWYRMTQTLTLHLCAKHSLSSQACALSFSHHCELYTEATTAHIPSDHSCVWHFKEDYENEMW